MTAEPGLNEALQTLATRAGVTLPPAAADKLAAYAEFVLHWNRVANLTGADSALQFVTRFLPDALAILPDVAGPQVVDLGSGNGLPGIVIAIMRPELRVTLVEARARRARFLQQTRIELELPNVEVINARIEDWHPGTLHGTVVSQAVGSLAHLVELTRDLHGPDCRLVALKGREPVEELAALGPAARACTVRRLAVPGWQERHVVVVDCAALPARD